MKIDQIYTGCLAQATYYIESDGEAAIIDPLRDVDTYLDKAKENNARIKYIFETHFHADFVSGHLDLEQATGASIVYGPTAIPSFKAIVAEDGQEFKLGKVKIKVLHTPGHTLESCCYLLFDEEGKEVAIFSGDTLFLGDVGRPDLAQNIAKMTQDELAGLLYESLQTKILPLPDDIIVYPAHGAGSACGKNMSTDRSDTLGHQKATNYALQPIDKPAFVRSVITGLTKPPQYFPLNVSLNKEGYANIHDILEKGTRALSVDEFVKIADDTKALILDTRPAEMFCSAHIPGSVNIGIDGDFAPWVGAVVTDIKQPILVVSEPGKESEVVRRLSRVGYDNSLGYLNGGIKAWVDAGHFIDTIRNMSAETYADLFDIVPGGALLDVRRASEFESEHVVGAQNYPLNYISEQYSQLDKNTTYYVYCAAGYRSVIFISWLKNKGFTRLVNIKGGFKEIKRNGRLFTSHYLQPTTML